jgi:hypothetical protein
MIAMTAKKKSAEDGELYLTNAIARYNPEVAEIARSGLKKMRKRYPGARVLVYDRRQSQRRCCGRTASSFGI